MSLHDILIDASEEALRDATDDELLFAALVINETPIYPGQDEEQTAVSLAAIYSASKREAAAATLAPTIVAVVSPVAILRALTGLQGWSDAVEATRLLPGGEDLLAASATALFTQPRWSGSYISYARELLEFVPSVDLLEGSVRRAYNQLWFEEYAVAVARELSRRGESRCLDNLVLDKPLLLSDSTWKALADYASKDALRTLATDPAAGFVYREHAMKFISDTELIELAATTPHENVRHGAEKTLALREPQGAL